MDLRPSPLNRSALILASIAGLVLVACVRTPPEPRGVCTLIDRRGEISLEEAYSRTRRSVIGMGDALYDCTCVVAREFAGGADDRELAGGEEGRLLAGGGNTRELRGDAEGRDLTGESEERRLAEGVEGRAVEGGEDDRDSRSGGEERLAASGVDDRLSAGAGEERGLAGLAEDRGLGGGASSILCRRPVGCNGFAVETRMDVVSVYDGTRETSVPAACIPD